MSPWHLSSACQATKHGNLAPVPGVDPFISIVPETAGYYHRRLSMHLSRPLGIRSVKFALPLSPLERDILVVLITAPSIQDRPAILELVFYFLMVSLQIMTIPCQGSAGDT